MKKNYIAILGSIMLLFFISSCSRDMNKIETELKAVYTEGIKMAQDITVKANDAKTGSDIISVMSEMSSKFKTLKKKEDVLIRKYVLTQPEMDKIMANLKSDLDVFSRDLEKSGVAIRASIEKYSEDKNVIAEYKKWQEALEGR